MYQLGSFITGVLLDENTICYTGKVLVYTNNKLTGWYESDKEILLRNARWYSFTWISTNGDKKQIYKTADQHTILSNCDDCYNPTGLFMLWQLDQLKQITMCNDDCRSHGLYWVQSQQSIIAAVYKQGTVRYGPFKITPTGCKLVGCQPVCCQSLFPTRYTCVKIKEPMPDLISGRYGT